MASRDTIKLLIVDYHAAIGGGARPRADPLNTPLRSQLSALRKGMHWRRFVFNTGRQADDLCPGLEVLAPLCWR